MHTMETILQDDMAPKVMRVSNIEPGVRGGPHAIMSLDHRLGYMVSRGVLQDSFHHPPDRHVLAARMPQLELAYLEESLLSGCRGVGCRP